LSSFLALERLHRGKPRCGSSVGTGKKLSVLFFRLSLYALFIAALMAPRRLQENVAPAW